MKVRAYFTVEAALVLPIVMGVILLMIYLWFFQYDRCLMEQDAGILALRGTTIEAPNNQERVRLLTKEARQIYGDKYVAWEGGKEAISIQEGKMRVKKAGRLRFPFQGLQFWSGKDVWEAEALYENQLLSPMSIIRNYRKITGGN